MQIKCPQCESEEVVKRGFIKTERRDKIQRFGCKSCNNRFVLDNPFFRMRNHQQMITQCTDMYYNWIRNHQALEKKTPSELACPNVQIENKNGWLELIERGYYAS